MHPILEQISRIGIVPVIKIDDPQNALPLAHALVEGGIPCAEVTFRTAQAADAIRAMAAGSADILVGAGTVLSTEQVDRAIDAGASFIVSPGFNPEVVAHCVKRGIPITPGCATPSDIERALAFGLEAVKFFPAEQAGGLDYIKAVSAPYGNVKFIPTGGINAENLGRYLAFDKVLACGGSWMVQADWIRDGRFDEIAALCREAVHKMLGFSLAHIGINTESDAEALRSAEQIARLFGFAVKPGSSSVFAGTAFEFMKAPYLGKNGHIAIATKSLSRARYQLERQGFGFRDDTEKRDASGAPMAIYLQDEFAGFAIHLLQAGK